MTDESKSTLFPPAGAAELEPLPGEGILIICDFDGTACSVDMGSKILDHFCSEEWRDIDRAFCTAEIGSREAYTRIAALMRGSREQMVEYVHTHATIDPYFAEFYRFCGERGYDLKIASDGLDFYIAAVLHKYNLADIEFFSNTATFCPGDGLTIDFPYANELCGKCGTCKTNILKGFAAGYRRIIYVGDSYSDVCPAKTADLVFAKYILYDTCQTNGTACIHYENFRDVMDYLLEENVPGSKGNCA
jgi:2-hydroxy-3-keto-5-methylthiopentenyl-1-phosphate phosphatase